MLFRRTPFVRALPALVLGATALALAVPTSLPASAAPGGSAGDVVPGGRRLPRRRTAPGQRAHGVGRGRRASRSATPRWAGASGGPSGRLLREQGRGLLRYGAAAQPVDARPRSRRRACSGVDVSSYQGKLKWSTWTKRDKDFAYVKATEGTSYKNPYFKNQYGGAAKAGMIRGAYHFASPNGKAGYKQARYFVKNGGGWSADGKTLPGVLDIEYNPYGSTCYGVSKKKMVKWVSSFTAEYKKLTGKDAVIYTTTDWWTQCTGNSAKFAKTNPLWVARYGTKKPGTLPKGWKTATFWQYTSNPIDQDVFPGKMKRLKVLATKK